MSDCCEDKSCAIDALRVRQSGTLKAVLGVNAVMFLVVLIAGLLAHSTALLSDALDNLGDALTYALSLYAVSGTAGTKARVALVKGFLILGAGTFVLGQVIYKIIVPTVPIFETMAIVAVLSLAADSLCLALLWKHRDEDVNMNSVWECSRNDIASNVAVIVAAGAVWLTHSQWPDVVVGAVLTCVFLRSAARVLTNACRALKDSRKPPLDAIRIVQR